MKSRVFPFLALGLGIALLSWSVRGRALPLGVHTLRADDATLGQIRDLGAQFVVQVFDWSEIEPTRGEFHWEYTDWLLRAAEYYHLRVVARLDKPPRWASTTFSPTALSTPPDHFEDYGVFVARVADRYRGRIAAYIIWNEPNLAREWGDRVPDPAAYTALLKVASTRLRATDPRAQILSAGLAPTPVHSARAMDDLDFMRAMYAAGARDAFDVLAVHPYAFANSPDDPRGAHNGLNFRRLEDLRDVMLANGDARPIWVTEFGYPTETPSASASLRVSENDQASWIARAFEITREQLPYVEMFGVWNLTRDMPRTADAFELSGYSLVHPDGSFKPAYSAIRAMQKGSPAATFAASIQSSFATPSAQTRFVILARDTPVHLGDSEYPLPWVPLYHTKNPSTEWVGEFYLRANELQNIQRDKTVSLRMELMQVNDFDTRVLVNDQAVSPSFLPAEDFTSIWVSAQFQVSTDRLRVGRNTVTVRDGKLFPAFQQLGYTWDDFQMRNVVLGKISGQD